MTLPRPASDPTSCAFPLIAPCHDRPVLVHRPATDSLLTASRPRVSAVNANFERTLNGQTVRESVDDMFARGATVHHAPPIRAMQRQVNLDQQASIQQLAERIAALEAALSRLLATAAMEGTTPC